MKYILGLLVLYFIIPSSLFAQSIDNEFSQKSMKEDLLIFKAIRLKANSGLYKHRTKSQIDSIYSWAENRIALSNTYRDFYNIICQLSDFEGSLHNIISVSKKINHSTNKENEGYFPYPLKNIEGKWIINFVNDELPLGSQIVSINNKPIGEIISSLYKYFSTDGYNITGKKSKIEYAFGKKYRLNYGLEKSFNVQYIIPNSNTILSKSVKSVSSNQYSKNAASRYSKPLDYLDDGNFQENYTYRNIDTVTSILTIHSFDIADNRASIIYKKYLNFLDSTFKDIKLKNIKNLIIDVRSNVGGHTHSLLDAYDYLTPKEYCENKSAWISFQKIPYLKYINVKIPRFIRPLVAMSYNKYFRKDFNIQKDDKYFEGPQTYNHKLRTPNITSYKGNVYLLINPRVASAASNFGALVASNNNTLVVGEETLGGYFGHNGHTPLSYILPNSKIVTTFSVVNLEQYVIEKKNQLPHRGIMPDYEVLQTYDDYINQIDTQLNFVLELIKKK